jgi:hypothetical protein
LPRDQWSFLQARNDFRGYVFCPRFIEIWQLAIVQLPRSLGGHPQGRANFFP